MDEKRGREREREGGEDEKREREREREEEERTRREEILPNSSTQARPIPLAPPVTMVTLSRNLTPSSLVAIVYQNICPCAVAYKINLLA